jgi:secondary thiamine-phosphate synthase enzyme
MIQRQQTIVLQTSGPSLYEFTDQAATLVRESAVRLGQLHIFCRHTSASLLIQENADPDVQRDLIAFFKRLVPGGDPLFIHRSEGPDDMPAHVKSALTQSALSIPVRDARMLLGTWQGLYLFEHRTAPHRREIVLHVVGE